MQVAIGREDVNSACPCVLHIESPTMNTQHILFGTSKKENNTKLQRKHALCGSENGKFAQECGFSLSTDMTVF